MQSHQNTPNLENSFEHKHRKSIEHQYKTIGKVSLDNCSLPILNYDENKTIHTNEKWQNNLVYNTIENFKNTTSNLTVRDVCPALCQTQYKPPGVSKFNTNTFTVPPTEPDTSVMERRLSDVLYSIGNPILNSLWQIPRCTTPQVTATQRRS